MPIDPIGQTAQVVAVLGALQAVHQFYGVNTKKEQQLLNDVTLKVAQLETCSKETDAQTRDPKCLLARGLEVLKDRNFGPNHGFSPEEVMSIVKPLLRAHHFGYGGIEDLEERKNYRLCSRAFRTGVA